MKIIRAYAYIVILITISCGSQQKMDAKSYLKWYNENKSDLEISRIIQELRYTIKYTPIEYQAIHETDDSDELHIALKEKKGLVYFQLEIESVEGFADVLKSRANSRERLQEWQYYYSYLFQNDITVEVGEVHFPCALFHFIQNPGMSNRMTFLLAFEKNKKMEERTLKVNVNDRAMNTGSIKFRFEKDMIHDLPKLKSNMELS